MSKPEPIRREARPEKRPNPKSADTFAARVWKRLSESPYQELRQIHCETRDGMLVLDGRVSSYFLKQVAQEIVRKMEGVPKSIRIANGLKCQHLRLSRRPGNSISARLRISSSRADQLMLPRARTRSYLHRLGRLDRLRDRHADSLRMVLC